MKPSIYIMILRVSGMLLVASLLFCHDTFAFDCPEDMIPASPFQSGTDGNRNASGSKMDITKDTTGQTGDWYTRQESIGEDGTATVNVSRLDGSTSTYTTHPSGSTRSETREADGTVKTSITNSNGTLTVTTRPDGTRTIESIKPDGTGTITEERADGYSYTEYERNPDGSKGEVIKTGTLSGTWLPPSSGPDTTEDVSQGPGTLLPGAVQQDSEEIPEAQPPEIKQPPAAKPPPEIKQPPAAQTPW